MSEAIMMFPGNIGFHCIHYLSLGITNYQRERHHQAEPWFQTMPPVTFFQLHISYVPDLE